jgi:hypothetical protein
MPITLDGTLGITTPALTVTGASTYTGDISTAGNLIFTTTGDRIIGDMSNGTLSNRLAFQTSTTNATTSLTVLPNGTSTTSQLNLEGDPASANGAAAQFINVGGSDVRIASSIRGSGTYLPLTMWTGGSERMRIDTSGRVLVGLSTSGSTASKLQVTGGTTNATSLATAYSDAAVAIVPKSTSGFSLAIASGTSDFPQLQVSANGAAAGALLLQPYGGDVFVGGTSGPVLGYEKFGAYGTGGFKTSGTSALGLWNTASSGLITFYTDTGTLGGSVSSIGGALAIAGGNNLNLSASGASVITLNTNSAERMRIDSTGRLLVGTTSTFSQSAGSVISAVSAGSNFVCEKSTGGSIAFYQSGVITGLIEDISSQAGLRFYTGTGGSVAERMRISAAGQVTKPFQPTFYGGRTAGDVAPSTVFVMNDAQINIGSCYNTTTGVFTCPVAGVYFASFGVMTAGAYGGDIDFFYIQKNGANVVSNYTTGTNTTYQRVAATVLISCAANDTIRFRTGGTTIYGASSTHSYGSIYLLS